jgi:alpha-tubulin N-acetyltransferase 1
MGEASALAQGLPVPITSASSFRTSEYTLYLKVQGTKCLGLIKTGYKNLYVREFSTAGMINIRPLCILDFYVNEKCQREGHGKHLFDCVLEDEKIEPKMLAYDRPSHKFLSFLRKHFNLYDYFPQSNNFVVFNEYFEKLNEENKAKKESRQHYTYNQTYYNPYGTTTNIRDKHRRGQGVFTALGSQMVQRSDSMQQPRSYSAYEKFQRKHS